MTDDLKENNRQKTSTLAEIMKGMEVDNDDDDDDDENDLIGKYAGLMMMELMMIC